MQANLLTPKPRIEVVDALRGFAVMAILLVHNLEHFIFQVYPDPISQPQWLNVLDQGVLSVVFSLFAGKSYAIFALLFGLTFHIQYTNQQKKGNDFGYRFLWRLILLTGFATINGMFFPGGDVLLLFSVVGIFLFAVRKLSDKVILIAAIFFLCQPIELFHYFASIINPSYTLPDLGVEEMYREVAVYVKKGNWGEFIWGNITLGQKTSFLWAVGAGRFLQTAGLFMLGLFLGRKQRFTQSETNTRFWVRTLIVGALLFCPIYALKVLLYDTTDVVMIKNSVGVIADMWQKLAFTFVLVPSFILIYQTKRFEKQTNSLRFYGRMSLTNYIMQSIIGALVYFPIALYLAPYCGYTFSLLIGIIVFLIQIRLSKWWLNSHKQGPLEYVWHKLTWIGTKKA